MPPVVRLPRNRISPSNRGLDPSREATGPRDAVVGDSEDRPEAFVRRAAVSIHRPPRHDAASDSRAAAATASAVMPKWA